MITEKSMKDIVHSYSGSKRTRYLDAYNKFLANEQYYHDLVRKGNDIYRSNFIKDEYLYKFVDGH